MRLGGFVEQTGERCPTGVQAATLVYVYDLGLQVGFEDKIQPKVCLWWESANKDSKGRPFTLPDVVTASSNEKSTMTQRYGSLMGAAPSEADMEAGYDTDLLIGKSCLILVQPSRKQGGWPYIENVMPLPPGMPVPPVIGEYEDGENAPKFVQMLRAKAVKSGDGKPAAKPLGIGDARAKPPPVKAGDAAFDQAIPF